MTGSSAWCVRFLFRTAFLLLCWYSPSLFAADAKSAGIDAVLVLDSSGSMKHTDPLNLRLPAAKLFVSLLGKDDRVGVISFSDRAEAFAELTPAHDEAGRQRLFQAIDKVNSRGLFTDLYAALDKAHALFAAAAAARPRYVILMSDGQMDTGDTARDRQLTAQLKNELVPALLKEHIILYTIAFSPESDAELLRALAEATHGQFRMAQFDKDLHGVFTSLFESSKQPDMLPIEGGQFHADSAIQEVTVVASKENAKVRIFLQAPDGKQWSAQDAGKDLRWFSSPAFDMITVAHPAEGDWKVLFSNGQNKAYIVTNLGIATDLKDQDHKRGETLTVTAWLSRDGEVVKQPEILQSTQLMVQLQGVDHVPHEFMLRDTGTLGDKTAGDGVYTGTVPLIATGQQQLRLIARSATFEREVVRHFKVVEPPPAPLPTKPAAPAKAPAAAPAAVPPRAPDDTVRLGWLLAGFVVFNLLAGGVIAAAVWWRRRRRAAPAGGAAAVTDDTPERS